MTRAEDERRRRAALLAMSERLVAHYRDAMPSGRVTAAVAVCRSELHRLGLRGDGLLEATEAMVRSRLNAHVDKPPAVPDVEHPVDVALPTSQVAVLAVP